MDDRESAILGVTALAVDCADPAGLARWWGRLLGGRLAVAADGDATLRSQDGLVIDFLAVPEPKAHKNRLHLDLRSSDLRAATEQTIALGASLADDVYSGGGWRVLRDPEGNEFCVLGPGSGPSAP